MPKTDVKPTHLGTLVTQFDPKETSSMYAFDQLSLLVAGWRELGKKNRSGNGGRLSFHGVVEHAGSRSHYTGNPGPVLTAGTAGCRGVLKAKLAEMRMVASTD